MTFLVESIYALGNLARRKNFRAVSKPPRGCFADTGHPSNRESRNEKAPHRPTGRAEAPGASAAASAPHAGGARSPGARRHHRRTTDPRTHDRRRRRRKAIARPRHVHRQRPRPGALPARRGRRGGHARGERGRPPRACSAWSATCRPTSSGSPASSPRSSTDRVPTRPRRGDHRHDRHEPADRRAGRATGKLDVTGIEGKWETSLEQVVPNPLPGVDRAFVIAGSDQRGTIYGVYDVSTADRRLALVLVGRRARPAPGRAVRAARPAHPGHPGGEVPRLLHQRREPRRSAPGRPRYFGPGKAPGYPGGFNADFYAKVFELMLRLKANYLWPAVWGRAFAEDDPRQPRTAKEYGIVMGTSHEAPMMRGIEEWNRHAVPRSATRRHRRHPGHDPYGGTGEWSFRRNARGDQGVLARRHPAHGRAGLRGRGHPRHARQRRHQPARRRRHRADGEHHRRRSGRSSPRRPAGDVTDDPAGVDPLQGGPALLGQGPARRRTTSPSSSATTTGATSASCPTAALPERSGGYGLYYHFDYVGGGRNYKWVDTISLPNTWEQLHLAYTYGDRPAVGGERRRPEGRGAAARSSSSTTRGTRTRWPLDRLGEWERRYAAAELRRRARRRDRRGARTSTAGCSPAASPSCSTGGSGWTRPRTRPTDPAAVVYDDEASPFCLTEYREMERVTEEWRQLAERAERIGQRLPAGLAGRLLPAGRTTR